MTNGFTKVPHSLICDGDYTIEERIMMVYLISCENRFKKEGKSFGLVDADFIRIGFGKDKEVLRRTRNNLISRGLIEFKQGGRGVKSRYRIIRDSAKVVEEEKAVEEKVVDVPNPIEPQTDRKTLWIVAIANEDPKWGTSRYIIFDKGWKEFYHNRYDAVTEVTDILKKKGINVNFR